jgi:hypothetical protein
MNRASGLPPFGRIDRILAREKELQEPKVIVAPEKLVAYFHRWHAEHATGDRLIRLRPKAAA